MYHDNPHSLPTTDSEFIEVILPLKSIHTRQGMALDEDTPLKESFLIILRSTLRLDMLPVVNLFVGKKGNLTHHEDLRVSEVGSSR